MNMRTYEILAKWIAHTQKVRIRFEANACPQACLETNEIILPDTVKEENVYAAIAQLMHEAAHLKHTKSIPVAKLTDDDGHKFMILNACEDIRIDEINFSLLPNIHEFYKHMIIQFKDLFEERTKTADLPHRVMCRGILNAEGFHGFNPEDKEAEEFSGKNDITKKMQEVGWELTNEDWTEAKTKIDELYKIFGFDKLPKIPLPQLPSGFTLNGDGIPITGGPCLAQEQAESVGIMDITKEKTFQPGKGQGQSKASGTSTIGEVAVREITRQKFKELLNIKEIKRTTNGIKLNTDNLTAFFTEDLDDLFEDEKIVKKKKSKIMIIMDGSGSMSGRLLDRSSRKEVVSGCAKALIEVLDEVIALEGINVDYTIAGFDDDLEIFTKENWQDKYKIMNGGTNLVNAFNKAQEYMLADLEAEGKKLIVFFTDGDVNEAEIDEVKRGILRHNEDVRVMLIGVGAELNSRFVTDIVGDFNILAKECADLILLETIMEML